MATVSSGEGSSAGERKVTGPASVHRRTIRPHRVGFIWDRPPYGRFGLSGIPHDPRNLPSSIAYRPPFTAISRNIGVIDMQTSHTTASAAATTSLARRIVAASWKPVLFAVLMWLSAAAGEIPIPGTPVPITLQTFVVMLAGLMLPWRQAGAAVATYLAAGAVGLPVFAGGTSTLALVGPSAGFLFGFLPGVVAIALLRGKSDTSSFAAAARTAGRYLLAALVGGVVVVYAFGFVIQSALTGAPLAAVALASMGFVVGDAIKAVVASLAAAGLSKLGR